MKIGYPCINLQVPCRASRTFRLASFSRERFLKTVDGNLSCLLKMLEFNAAHGIEFLRITSDVVPFASHPMCTVPWPTIFRKRLREIGRYIRDRGMRVAMHPDQFVLINAQDEEIFGRSVAELDYHVRLLDEMELDGSAKVQIHVGGTYGDKAASLARFAKRYRRLSRAIRRRLVVENDDRQYTTADCLLLNEKAGIPVVFDYFHESVLPSGRSLPRLLRDVSATWARADGLPIVDYSSQMAGHRRGTHARSLNQADFARFLALTQPYDFDVMLEIKDKESSAIKAMRLAAGDPRRKVNAALS